MSRRKYRRLTATTTGAGSCSNFCVNVCTRLFVTGVQQCITDCLACSGESSSVVFLSDPEFFDNDD